MRENELSGLVIGAAIDVHSVLGPGMLEAVYANALAYEIRQLGLDVRQEVRYPLIYKGIEINVAFRADIVVEDKLILEIKSVERMHEIFLLQTLTYLKVSGLKLGLLINFNNKLLKDGIHRVVHKL
jgi:GxxExxY protein